jgi:hypothetical protein
MQCGQSLQIHLFPYLHDKFGSIKCEQQHTLHVLVCPLHYLNSNIMTTPQESNLPSISTTTATSESRPRSSIGDSRR